MSFWVKDGIQWVGFGDGTVAIAHSKAFPEKSGPQIEVHLCDPGKSHPISKTKDCPAEVMRTYPLKVALGFNKLESLEALIDCLKEARAELEQALAEVGVRKAEVRHG